MKKFMEPEVNVEKLTVEDIITTSGSGEITGGESNGNVGGSGNED